MAAPRISDTARLANLAASVGLAVLLGLVLALLLTASIDGRDMEIALALRAFLGV